MLGALHRILRGKKWYTWFIPGAQGWQGQVKVTMRHLLVEMQEAGKQTVVESGMARLKPGAHFHEECAPWAEDYFHAVRWDQLSKQKAAVDEKHFEKQRAKSGAPHDGPVSSPSGEPSEPTPEFFRRLLF